MPFRLDEAALLVAAPLLALIFLVLWLGVMAKKSPVLNLKLNFLGLSLTVRTCSVSEGRCAEMRRRADDTNSVKGSSNGCKEDDGN